MNINFKLKKLPLPRVVKPKIKLIQNRKQIKQYFLLSNKNHKYHIL